LRNQTGHPLCILGPDTSYYYNNSQKLAGPDNLPDLPDKKSKTALKVVIFGLSAQLITDGHIPKFDIWAIHYQCSAPRDKGAGKAIGKPAPFKPKGPIQQRLFLRCQISQISSP